MTLESIKVSPGELATVSGKPDKEKTEGGTPLLVFEIMARGTMEVIKNFLDRFDAATPIMQIEEVSLSYEEGEWQGKISLNSFYLPLPKTLGVMETPLVKITPDEEIVYKRIEKFRSAVIEETLPPVRSGKEDLFSF